MNNNQATLKDHLYSGFKGLYQPLMKVYCLTVGGNETKYCIFNNKIKLDMETVRVELLVSWRSHMIYSHILFVIEKALLLIIGNVKTTLWSYSISWECKLYLGKQFSYFICFHAVLVILLEKGRSSIEVGLIQMQSYYRDRNEDEKYIVPPTTASCQYPVGFISLNCCYRRRALLPISNKVLRIRKMDFSSCVFYTLTQYLSLSLSLSLVHNDEWFW